METVREIMRTELVTVGPEMSIHDLARLLADKEISGAPVVDGDGEVLGVVSMSDLVRLAAAEVPNGATSPLDEEKFSPNATREDEDEGEDEEEEDLVDFFQHVHAPAITAGPAGDWAAGGDLDQYDVRAIMTPANFHIHPDSDLRELAAFLLRGRIHRALVMEDNRLVGIVTTVDLIRTMVDPA